jgi:hypothetical protein
VASGRRFGKPTLKELDRDNFFEIAHPIGITSVQPKT